MSKATKGMNGDFVTRPSNVIFSNGEYFVDGTQYGVSDLANDVEVEICEESGFLATEWCPHRKKVKLQPTDDKAKFYCPLHNKDVKKYPIAEGQTLNKDFKTEEEIKAEEEKKKQEEELKRKQEEEQRQKEEEERQRQEEEQNKQQDQEQQQDPDTPDPPDSTDPENPEG